eukprot:99950-Chlamydomonas_euryale.AAC.2
MQSCTPHTSHRTGKCACGHTPLSNTPAASTHSQPRLWLHPTHEHACGHTYSQARLWLHPTHKHACGHSPLTKTPAASPADEHACGHTPLTNTPVATPGLEFTATWVPSNWSALSAQLLPSSPMRSSPRPPAARTWAASSSPMGDASLDRRT